MPKENCDKGFTEGTILENELNPVLKGEYKEEFKFGKTDGIMKLLEEKGRINDSWAIE